MTVIALRAVTAQAHTPLIGSVDRADFVSAMSATVAGVNVVTTDGNAGRFGITATSMVSVSADPPMVLVCINRRSPACAAVQGNGAFCVNALSTEQHRVAETFSGRPTHGKPYDFDAFVWTAGKTGALQLVDAIATFECVLQAAHDAGSHTIFIGRVVATRRGNGSPLLYTDRAYGAPRREDL